MPADLITMADQVRFTLDYSWLQVVLSFFSSLLKNQQLQIPIQPK